MIKDENGVPKFHFLGIGGLYYTKGMEHSQPMIYGHPAEFPINFRPQLPVLDSLQECRGIAMGFTLWNLQALLNDKRLGPPWYETKQDYIPGAGVSCGTQDLVMCGKALQFGYRFAVDCATRVGHMNLADGLIY